MEFITNSPEQTEKVEHFILPRTLISMERFLAEDGEKT